MKRFLLFFLCCMMALPVYAAEEEVVHVFDNAKALRRGEDRQLQTILEPVSKDFQVGLYLLTESNVENENLMEYAEYYYLTNRLGYGDMKDGILVFLCMDRREMVIYANGVGLDAVTDEEAEEIRDAMRPLLIEGEYVEAVKIFAELCVIQLDEEVNRVQHPALAVVSVVAVVGAGGAMIVTGILRKRKKQRRSY